MHAISEDDLLESIGKQIANISDEARMTGSIASAVRNHLKVMSDVERGNTEFAIKLIHNTTDPDVGTSFTKSVM